ncbi:hypothetical protein A1O3_00975 [Capronia epimyces CBS 606.96]|uniref:Uncharacterized protein n=1 Tax=Capronia epimyces CBS 606.96 TaxID=1182542 RepID=W9ZD44_9EURO|nr:uncharacterized protein A1O3_00975 [Capronia epimyces CBS 606.96]EXJ92424.1 hypothetical protein A1O3_00975 [Capronia epimyces CBS 606.96]
MSVDGNNPSSTAAAAAPQPESGSVPLAAQISLKGFELPEFPPQASRLRQLTLTADIKLDEYQGKVQMPLDAGAIAQPPLPTLPPSITHLTLELFGLGFPGRPPFLEQLARALPNITTLTFFSCLIDGLDDASRKDAEAFFQLLPHLQELHVIDSFARPGFFRTIGGIFEDRSKQGQDSLKMVEVSYTFRGHQDRDFLARVQGEELPNLIVGGVVGASFDFMPEMVDELVEGETETAKAEEERPDGDKEKEKEKVAEGILPFASDGRAPTALKKRFEHLRTESLQSVKVLNLGMWSLRPVEVGEILYACAGGGKAGLADLTVSILLEDNWFEEFIKGFIRHKGIGAELEGVEVIGAPDRAKREGEGKDENEDEAKGADRDEDENEKGRTHGLSLVRQADVEKLGQICPKLAKFGMSILKVKSAPHLLFFKDQGGWTQQ